MNGKKFCGWMILAATLFTSGVLRADVWSIRFAGQYGAVRYSDFNRYVDDWNDSHDASLYPRLGHMKSSMGFSFEASKQIARVHVGAGIGYLTLEAVDYKSGEMASKHNTEIDFKHTVHAVPIQVFGRYDLLDFRKITAYAGGAVTYYLTSLTFEERQFGYLTDSELYEVTQTSHTDMDADRFGLNGFLGIEFPVSKCVSLDVRVAGRWANLGGFAGTKKWDEVTDGPVDTETSSGTQGVYLVYENDSENGITYGPRQDSAWQTDEREGKLDLSGIEIEFGIKIAFPW